MSDQDANANSNHVVVLVHGIRDFAYWASDIRHSLEARGFVVELTNYGRFDLLRFLVPVTWFRDAIVERVWHQIEQIYQNHPGKAISFIAHSFGTYVLTEIMVRKFKFRSHRVIFCGSVVSSDAPLEQITNRFDPPVLNEVGTNDVWPALAQSVTFGYGSAGSYGFKRPNVRDRWHAGAGHSHFLNSEFCIEYWVPFLERGTVVAAENNPVPPAWWVQLLYIVPAKFVLLAAIALLLFLAPWHRIQHWPVERWVEVSEAARSNRTIHASTPLPDTVVQARTAFEGWWVNTGVKARQALPADLAYKALSNNGRLYRVYEVSDPLKPNANYWTEQCLSHFEQAQNAEKITECLLDRAALYLELSQIQHTNANAFQQIAETGEFVMNRAASIASERQKPIVNRMASRFYYNLARPAGGLLSSQWNNNYLALAVERAKKAYEQDPSDFLNVNQMSRAIQRMAGNPPNHDQPYWTEELRRAQQLLAQAYRASTDASSTPHERLPVAHIFAVITMDLARREWSASSKTRGDAEKAVSWLLGEPLSAQTNAWALVQSTEWAKDYAFDVSYDLVRIRCLVVQILDSVQDPRADGIFDQAVDDLIAAVKTATTTQLRATHRSIDSEPSFAGLSDARRARLREVAAVK